MDDVSIIVIGYVGITGTRVLIEEKKENLLSRFSLNFLQSKIDEIKKIEDTTKKIDLYRFCKNNLLYRNDKKEYLLYETKKGGFLSTLWMNSQPS